MARKVLLIGLDAADKDLLLEGCDKGLLPNFARLREEGAWGVAEAPPGFGSGAIWPSLFTGVSPAKHGRYFYRQVWPGNYEADRFKAHHFRAKAVWEVLSAAGKRTAVFDVPKAGLSEGLNGVHAVDWIVHGPVYKELTTWPPEFGDELSARFGIDPMPQCDLPGGRDAAGHADMRDVLLDRIRRKEEATLHYLAQEPWDLMYTVFGEPHCVGHQSWHVRDPGHPRFEADAFEHVGDPVLDVYAAIDDSIGRMMAAADDDTVVIVLSGTGMGPNYTGNLLLDEVLRRIQGRKKTRSLDLLSRMKQRAKRVLPVELRRRWRQTSRRVEERVSHVDRQQRSFFTVPHNDIAGAIRVNLVGREPEGKVRPEEVDHVFEALRRDLLDLRNLETGEPVVKDVVRTADYCTGDHLDDMPDFFVLWRRDAPITRVGSAKVGEVMYRHVGNRTGDHVSESIFFAKGPGVRPGAVDPVSIMDIAPTIAAVCEVDYPDTDGKPIAELGV